MSILNQKTVLKPVSISGIGLHTGLKSTVKILPSSPNSGIIFNRVDIKNNKGIVNPSFSNVSETNLCTTVSNEYGIKISTIEHLMGALYGVGIDNAIIEIDNEELPILDGSAKNWVNLIKGAGVKSSDAPIKIIKIEKQVEIFDNQKFIKINSSNVSLDIKFEIKYPGCLIDNQTNKVNVLNDDLTEIFNSRTFCKFDDIDKLKSLGLAKGGSLENALVVKNDKILNSKIRAIIASENIKTGSRLLKIKIPKSLPIEFNFPNKRIQLRVPINDGKSRLIIPKDGLIADGIEKLVYIVEKNKVKRRTVTLGQSFKDQIEIKLGVNEGDLVVVKGNENIRPNQSVKIKKNKK